MHKVTYHPLVTDDMDALPRVWQKRVMSAVDTKLTSEPATYGKPLRNELWPLYSLRVGDYRVLYILKKAGVYVVLVRHRRDVYKEAVKRATRS